MKTRLLTAAVGVPFLLFVLAVRGWFAELVTVTLTLVSLWECYHALQSAGYRPCVTGGYLAAAVMWPLARLIGVRDPLLLLVVSASVSLAGVVLRREPKFPDAAASVYPLVTCLLPMSMFMLMMNGVYGPGVPGIALITLAFAIAFGSDGAAYFGGSRFGKHQLSPAISPKKTVEGALFGLLGALALAALIWYVFRVMRVPMPGLPLVALLALVGSAAAQVGDLTASLLKRHAGLKDYGAIFPGHGGVLDRLDSVFFTMIVIYCYALVVAGGAV